MITRVSAIVLFLMMVAAAAGTSEELYTFLSPNEEQGGSFGFSISGAGDVDDDGYADVVVGAPGEDPGSNPHDVGRAYVFSGRTGSLLVVLSSPTVNPGGRFGNAVAGVGDVNGDGYDDVAVGACHETYGIHVETGRAYLFSGQTGSLLHTLVSPDESAHDNFGWSVSGVGDIDDDLFPDVVVGAPGEYWGRGKAYVFSGQTGGLIYSLTTPSTDPDGWFGQAVSRTSDLDGDGYHDVVVGAPGDDPGSSPSGAGRAYVFSGQTGALLRTLVSPNEEEGGFFGYSVSGVGDVNGDSLADIVVGAPYEDPNASPDDAGRAYVLSGQTGSMLQALASPNENLSGWFGQAVSSAGDVNGDGCDDVMVGANRENPGASPEWAGRAHIFSGKNGDLLCALVSPNEEEWGYFGYSVAAAGDVNGDGHPDVVVGAHNEAPNGSPSWAGRAYVFSWMQLSSELAGSDLVLQWSPWSPASEYWIYGASNEPWFVPDTSPPTFVNRVAVVPAGTTAWSSPSGIGDPAANWTYLVTAVDAAEQELARSNRVGEVDFEADIP